MLFLVGSGSGGSVVAGRLAEVSGWQVLVLEAGEQAPSTSKIPGMSFFALPFGSSSSWNYMTVPQKHAQYNYVNNVSIQFIIHTQHFG